MFLMVLNTLALRAIDIKIRPQIDVILGVHVALIF